MKPKSPFKFLDSYGRVDREIFFGRSKEIEDIYTKVFLGKILLIYGESGTGKSSLINCGLANKFVEADWLPVNVRRGNSITENILDQLARMAITPLRRSKSGKFVDDLKKYSQSIYLDYFKPIYFIFDQFEELFIFGNRSEWMEFIDGVYQLTLSDLNVHFIFIIRAEYLHQLSVFEEIIPEFFDNRVRVEKMTRKNALECIEGPSKFADIEFEDDFAENLLFQLSPETTEIELTYLQVFLDKVYRKTTLSNGEDTLVFTNKVLDDLGMVSDVLSEFLEEQLNEIAENDKPLTLIKAFVSKDGTKRQVTQKDAIDFTKSIGKQIEELETGLIIKEFVNRRILKEQDEAGRYELRHDALAEKIFQKISLEERELIEARQFIQYAYAEHDKRGFLLNEADLSYITPLKFKLNLSPEYLDFINESDKVDRKKRRNRKRVFASIVTITILLITSVIGLFYAQQQRANALQQQQRAERNADEAQKQQVVAEQNAEVAQIQKTLADSNRLEAERQAQLAQLQRITAEQQRSAADSNRLEAEKQKLLALIQKDSAELQRLRAEEFAKEAELLRKGALRVQKQTLARSIAIKANSLTDRAQKALLSLQAYLFNRSNQGYAYQSDIHQSLYQAQKANTSPQFNFLQGHTAAVRSVIARGKWIYTTGSDGNILRWNFSSRRAEPESLISSSRIFNAMAISPSGRYIAAGTSSTSIMIYESANGQLVKTIPAHSGKVWHLEFISNDLLLSSGGDQTIKQWNLKTGDQKVWVKGMTNIHAFISLPSGHLITGSEDGIVFSYSSPNDNTPIKLLEQTGDPVTALALSNNDQLIAIGFESGSIQLWDIESQAIVQTLAGHTAHVSDLKFSSNDQFLISGGYDRKNLLWNLRHIKEQPIVWNDHDSFVLAVSFTPDGRRIITGALNGTMKFYEKEMSRYADQMCVHLTRNLTKQEWNSFIGENFQYQKTCQGLPQ